MKECSTNMVASDRASSPRALWSNFALLVDLDGVLVDTEDIWRNAYRTVFARDYQLSVAEGDLERLYGINFRDVANSLAQGAQIQARPDLPDSIIREVCSCIDKLLPVIPPSVRFLRDAMNLGIKVAIVSSSPSPVVEAGIRVAGFADAGFEVIIDEDVQAHKPAPDPYLLAAERVGIPPEMCLAVEDSPAGVISAVRAGAGTIWLRRSLYGGWRSEFDACLAIVQRLDLVNLSVAFELVERRHCGEKMQ